MTNYNQQIKEAFSHQVTEELVDRVNTGTLTEEAHNIAIAELLSRGVGIDKLPQKPSAQTITSELNDGFIHRCWHGKVRLYKAFWGLGILLSGVSLIFYMALHLTPLPILGRLLILALAIIPIDLLYLVSVWRCAFNTKFVFFAYLARLSVLSGTAFAIFSVFLLFEAFYWALM